jgi:hypothetical protein
MRQFQNLPSQKVKAVSLFGKGNNSLTPPLEKGATPLLLLWKRDNSLTPPLERGQLPYSSFGKGDGGI